MLAFAECRRWAGDQCTVPSNTLTGPEYNRSICSRRSTDGGRSWGPLAPNITRRYAANPSAVHDRARNRTTLFFNDARYRSLYSMASADGGVTWGEATPLIGSGGGSGGGGGGGGELAGVSGPGNSVVLLDSGVLLHAVYTPNKTVEPRTAMFSYATVLRSEVRPRF